MPRVQVPSLTPCDVFGHQRQMSSVMVDTPVRFLGRFTVPGSCSCCRGRVSDELSACGDDADFGFVDEHPDGCSDIESADLGIKTRIDEGLTPTQDVILRSIRTLTVNKNPPSQPSISLSLPLYPGDPSDALLIPTDSSTNMLSTFECALSSTARSHAVFSAARASPNARRTIEQRLFVESHAAGRLIMDRCTFAPPS